jgi:adenylate cyclase
MKRLFFGVHFLSFVLQQDSFGGIYLSIINPNIALFGEIRLNPFDTTSMYAQFAVALRMAGRFEEAVLAFKKSFQRAPDNIMAHVGLLVTYSVMGREKEARAEAAEVLRINPRFSVDNYAKLMAYKDQSEIDKMVNAMRKAGLK